ncbi:hypothetical protein PC114_g20192 [Phytophthora cactorum]|nr:hypothetical protein PC114_g20192 [Phytophthora cactorum]
MYLGGVPTFRKFLRRRDICIAQGQYRDREIVRTLTRTRELKEDDEHRSVRSVLL